MLDEGEEGDRANTETEQLNEPALTGRERTRRLTNKHHPQNVNGSLLTLPVESDPSKRSHRTPSANQIKQQKFHAIQMKIQNQNHQSNHIQE
jgi:hypothetical protein